MPIRRRKRRREPVSAGGPSYGPSWNVPPTFNFAHDAIAVLARERHRPAMIHVTADGTVDRCTFADVLHESLGWEGLLRGRALDPGSRVVIALDPGKAWAAAILGALRIGLIPVPVGVGLDADELAERALQVDPALVVVDRRSAQPAAQLVSRLPLPPAVFALEEARWGVVHASSAEPPVRRPVSSPALILFTAGRTTGRPRPVVHAHAATFAAYVPARDWLDAQPTDRVWCAADGGSGTAVWHGLFGPWSAGAEVLLIDREVDADGRIELMRRFPPSIVVQTPAGYVQLLDELEEHGTQLEGLRNAASTDARLSLALRRRFRKVTGVDLLDGYSTAETGTIAFQAFGVKTRAGSIGVSAPGHVVAPIDDAGVLVPAGVMGDLAVYGRPPSLCAGYWAGAPPDVEPGGEWWTLTGDRAAIDEQDNLWLEKRAAAKAATKGAAPQPRRGAERDAQNREPPTDDASVAAEPTLREIAGDGPVGGH